MLRDAGSDLPAESDQQKRNRKREVSAQRWATIINFQGPQASEPWQLFISTLKPQLWPQIAGIANYVIQNAAHMRVIVSNRSRDMSIGAMQICTHRKSTFIFHHWKSITPCASRHNFLFQNRFAAGTSLAKSCCRLSFRGKRKFGATFSVMTPRRPFCGRWAEGGGKDGFWGRREGWLYEGGELQDYSSWKTVTCGRRQWKDAFGER